MLLNTNLLNNNIVSIYIYIYLSIYIMFQTLIMNGRVYNDLHLYRLKYVFHIRSSITRFSYICIVILVEYFHPIPSHSGT